MSTNKQTLGGRPSTRVWPLSGVIFCGCCKGVQGKPLVGFGAVNKDRRTYRCTSLTRKGFTYCRSFYHADTLEEKARRAIREALSPGRLAAIARERAEDANAAVGNPEQRQREIGAELRELKAKEDTLIEMRLEGLSAEAFSRKVAEVNSSRANLEKQLAEVRAQAAQLRDPEEAARAADALAAELSVDLDAALADPVDFKRLARMLLSIRLFTDREPEIEVRVPTVLHPVSG